MSAPVASGTTSRYGPYALIAGGSEGIGEAFAWLFAEAGVNLALG